MADLIVTLDGPAASGKSTVARLVAKSLEASFLDTGATYRAATWAALHAGVDLQNSAAVLKIVGGADFQLRPTPEGMAISVDGQDVSEAIRDPELTAQVRHLAGNGEIRAFLVQLQRDYAAGQSRIVTEGRDQGTVVFPHAQVKIFLTASPRERAQRRCKELSAKGTPYDLDQLEADIAARDEGDRNREVGPLKPAPDAIEVDTTGLSIEQVVDRIVSLVRKQVFRSAKNGPGMPPGSPRRAR